MKTKCRRIIKCLWIIIIISIIIGCSKNGEKLNDEHKILAEKFIRGVYGCEPSVVDEFAADSVFITYPIFKELFNKPVIKGREAVKDFANVFCKRWKEAQITIHQSIAEGNKVVFVWSFSAIRVTTPGDADSGGSRQSWGGITLYRFNDAGKIVSEIGEESSPGPFKRSNE